MSKRCTKSNNKRKIHSLKWINKNENKFAIQKIGKKLRQTKQRNKDRTIKISFKIREIENRKTIDLWFLEKKI